MATARPAILTNLGWRNCSIDWQIAFGREGHRRIPRALACDDESQTAWLAGRLLCLPFVRLRAILAGAE